MTFYQELQLNQAGSKNLLKSKTVKRKIISYTGIFGKDSCYNGILFFICYYFQYLIWK